MIDLLVKNNLNYNIKEKQVVSGKFENIWKTSDCLPVFQIVSRF